ncbi:MAG: hypothetical protein M3467_00290, partial [Actinomycetota bacterium]|nr:hypothetical protein [Actinomycetota bacterium]
MTALVVTGLVSGFVTGPSGPALARPGSSPRPVAPQLHTLELSGVDRAALVGLRTSGADAPEVLTAPRRTEPFELLGVTWAAAAADRDVEVAVRTHTAGRWSGWERLELADGLAPGEAADEAAAISR